MTKDTIASASDALQKARELAELHREFDFKESSKTLGRYSDSICLRDGDFRIDFSDNNMSVYEDCKFVQGDTECSCWDDAADSLRRSSEFVEGCYKNFPSIHAELEKVTAERDELKKQRERIFDHWHDTGKLVEFGQVTRTGTLKKELEKLKAERDELLKGHRGMREEITKIEQLLQDSCEHDDGCSSDCDTVKYPDDEKETCNCYVMYRSEAIDKCTTLLTSFPEIK